MVDVVGHLGMALVWLAPAWSVVDHRKTAATVVGVGFWFGMLPDADLVLRQVFPTVKHHGILHTVLAVTLLAAVLGPLVGGILERTLGDTEWFEVESVRQAAVVGFVMVFVAGVAHVFADMLSAPDIAEAIEPFWPVYKQSLGIDVVWYDAPWFNWGLLAVGIALNAGLYYRRRTRDAG